MNNNSNHLRISIFGLGYVGCVGIGCLASQGHTMIGVDRQQSKVDFINSGKATIIEKDIDGLMEQQYQAGRVSASTDSKKAVLESEVSFICVGTPSTSQGHLNLNAIYKVAEEIGAALKEKNAQHVVAVRSTVLPGTCEKVAAIIAEHSGKAEGIDFAVVSNPEFLREGSAIKDYRNPPFTLIGCQHDWAVETMRKVYAELDAPFLPVAVPLAEMMKYVCNSFHALKITFANEVGNICDTLGIDGRQLMEIFCKDTKLNISPAYLKPGFAYGGSCLPKDLKALRTIAHDNYLKSPVLHAIESSNEYQKDLALNKIMEAGKRKLGFIGLAFKAGTDDLRESPIVEVIEKLLGKGYEISIYDPHVHISQLTGANKEYIQSKIPYISRFITNDLDEVINASEVLVSVNVDATSREKLKAQGNTTQLIDLSGSL
ncbi:UDP-glucose/GDP-mannose dehydrogenase family protein [Pelagicoccus sp. SDUM812003]|uniref:UDP-glucose/GDP-mannose dehydrogenase family protein n=1 Tax=Pelagicoccus sp. SDUM812003 TaxID=3041267 RepID=UPI00280E3F49|nr:UDP-glucose/GDP-mannose dehydrogenase family protein [Pelagicoccus sp. SDUM812003]MDQ8204985.1 UDP-glucose/GDP-mannose dehydrogenase family protein [Pelagicoccus sp. SDUM812003]